MAEPATTTERNVSVSESWWRNSFYIDLRTLALFRIALGALIFVDLYERLKHVRLYYTDLGILPQEAIDQVYGASIRWTSLHYHTGGSVALQSLMIVVSLAFAVALLLGYRTRWATLITWVLLVSLGRRVPTLNSGADETIRLMLFWGFFLPLGARYSVDQIFAKPSNVSGSSADSHRFVSMGTVAILLQICYVYWFTVVLKMHPSWLGGTAVQEAMQLEFNTRPIGYWLGEQTYITVPLTYATLFCETFMPLIAISPVFSTFCRWIAVLSMWGLHLGIAIFMTIGLFPYASLVCWILFIPSATWDWLEQRFSRLRVEVSSSPEFNPKEPSQRAFAFEKSKLVSWAVIGFFSLVTAYNVLGLDQLNRRGIGIPRPLELVASVLRLDQKWKMYAPTPKVLDGWYLMPARLTDGQTVDLFTGESITFEKPGVLSAMYSTPRMKKLLLHFRDHQKSPVWQWIARHYAQNWDAEHPDSKVESMQIVFLGEQEHNGTVFQRPYLEYDVQQNTFAPLSEVSIR